MPYSKTALAPYSMLDVRELLREVVGRTIVCPAVGHGLTGVPAAEGLPLRMTEELTKLWTGEERSPQNARSILAIGFGRHLPMLGPCLRFGTS